MSAPDMLIDCGALREHVETLSVALARWAYRDDSKAQPQVREAANTAVDALDAALAELHRIRGRLVGEIRESDDAAMRRVDHMLAELRAGHRAAGQAATRRPGRDSRTRAIDSGPASAPNHA